MSQYTRILVLVIGIMMLAPAQLLVTANHNDWFTSKYRDGTDDPGHEVPANTVPIPIDTEMGTGPCAYSMVLYSDTDTWHLDDGVPATVHTAPAGQNWMTPYGNSYWMWGSDQTAAGEYTFVRPVQLPANAYSIEARIQLGVNDFYKLYIQHGDGAISQHLDTDYSHSNSQQGEPTDLWTDDVAAGLNYFIFAANNSDSPDPDGNGTPGTAEGGLMFQIDIIYCRDPGPPPCDEGDKYVEVQYASDLSVQYIDPDAAMTTSTATWASVYAPTQDGAWANPPSPGIWIWAGVDADGDGFFEDVGQGTFMFRHDFNVPQYAYDFNFAFNGMADNVILYDPIYGLGSGTDISITPQGALSIPLSSPVNLPLYLSPAPSNLPSAIVNHYNTNLGVTMMIPPTASNSQWDFAQETDISLVVFARNRQASQSAGGGDTAGGLAYTLDVSYCEGTEEPDYPDVGDYNNRTKCNTFEGGFDEGITFPSDTDTYYLDSGSWQPTQLVDGSYSTNAPSNWGMANYYWGVGYSSNYVYNPPLAHQSKWIWNSAYAKADGQHEFIRGFQLPSNVITAHARLFYSADERVLSAYITDQTGAIDYTPSGLEDSGASVTQYADIFNTGQHIQLANGGNLPQAGDNLYLHILAEDTEPNWDALAQAPAAWGDYDYVDPAGLRYTLEVCFTVEETPPNDPPPTNCTQIDAPLVERTIVSGGGMYNTWHRDVGATTWINTPINPLTTNPIGNGDWVGTWPDMTAQWVWPQTDQPQANAYPSPHNDISGQVFEMRTLVTVPANAQIIQISFWGHADNRFIGPVEVTPDPLVANLPTQTLAVPPSGTDHHTSWQPMVSGGPIALPTIDPINVQEFEVTWSVSNRDLGGTTRATIGGVIWGIDLSYCEVEVGSVSDPDHTRDSGDDGDDGYSIPGFTAVLLLSGVVLVAVVTNRRPRN